MQPYASPRCLLESWSRGVCRLIALCFCLGPLVSVPAQPRPNLIFILADDLRWDALGALGNAIVRTPNIGRLAAQGVTFQNCFTTTSICAVSRASIFTGQYARRHGIENFNKTFTLVQWAESYPALLRTAGYRTGFVGKFGVGGRKAVEARATEFDFWRGFSGQGGEYFIDPRDATRAHATARFGDQALEFLAGGESNQPFCLSVSFNAPHARDGQPREFQPDLRDEFLHATDAIPLPASATEEAFRKLPEFVQQSEARRRWTSRFATAEMFQRTMRDYYRLVAGIDREVGRLMTELARRGLAGNTVIIFTSDNGWFAGEHGLADKWFMYEESLRLPLVIHDPRAARSRRGIKVDSLVLNIDFAPTLLELAGIRIPKAMQGRSLVALLAGKEPAEWRKDFFYEHHYAPAIIPPSEGVRTERWSYIHWLPPNPEVEELYDLATDPLQMDNLAGNPHHAATITDLRARWRDYQRSLK